MLATEVNDDKLSGASTTETVSFDISTTCRVEESNKGDVMSIEVSESVLNLSYNNEAILNLLVIHQCK